VRIHRLSIALGAGFFLIAVTTGYWGLARRDELLARPDNPRRILAEQRYQRGNILDRNGEVLAESIGLPGDYVRHYPYPDLAPVLGYVSTFYGLAGIEAAEDAILHGDAGREAWDIYWQETLGGPLTGRAVRLTINLRLQRAADEALGDATGAVILLDVTTGEILALASYPTFDAHQLEADWQALTEDPRAPLLNRATFALYQPGGALQPTLLAAALDNALVDLDASFPTTPFTLGEATLTCEAPTQSLPLAQAFQRGCPAPFVEIGQRLGPSALNQLFTDLRLTEAPVLGLPTLASPFTDTVSDLSLSALGQGPLTLTPLHVVLLTAALAHHGEMPAPQLVHATKNLQSQWEPALPPDHPIAVFTPESVSAVKALMSDGHRAIALTGAGANQTSLAWFSGFAPFETPRYAVVVLLENGELERAREIGQAVLAEAVRSQQ